MTVTAFLLTLGAVARITRFVNADTLFESVRAAVLRRFGPGYWYTLVTCPWCLSIWTAAAVVPVGWFAGRSPAYLIPAMVLSISYLYAIAATHLDKDDDE